MAINAPLRLGAFVANARYEDLPAGIVDKAKRHILDTLGAGLAGATSQEAKRTLAALLLTDGPGPAAGLGAQSQPSPPTPGPLHGTAAHALQPDATAGRGHLVAPVR